MNHGDQRVFSQFEIIKNVYLALSASFKHVGIITNVWVSSLCFIWTCWIPMLWVYGYYKYFNSFSAGTVFIRQNLPSTDVRFWRIKTVPYRRQIVTCEEGPRAERVKIIMGVWIFTWIIFWLREKFEFRFLSIKTIRVQIYSVSHLHKILK